LLIGLCIYFFYGRHHSLLGKALRGEIVSHGVSPAGMISDDVKPLGDHNKSGEDGIKES
jgi:hypothetical protein